MSICKAYILCQSIVSLAEINGFQRPEFENCYEQVPSKDRSLKITMKLVKVVSGVCGI